MYLYFPDTPPMFGGGKNRENHCRLCSTAQQATSTDNP